MNDKEGGDKWAFGTVQASRGPRGMMCMSRAQIEYTGRLRTRHFLEEQLQRSGGSLGETHTHTSMPGTSLLRPMVNDSSDQWQAETESSGSTASTGREDIHSFRQRQTHTHGGGAFPEGKAKVGELVLGNEATRALVRNWPTPETSPQ